jgi:uncharacterized protein (TIGR02996 family)
MAKKRTPRQAGTSDGGPEPNEPSLLAAVLADPDADAPRLAYADRLDRHGQPERAEFIRLQIERARRPWPDGETPGAREAALLAAHGEEWLRPLLAWRSPYGREYFHFHRGFPERVHHLEFDQFVNWDERIWRTAPVSHVTFTDYYGESGEYRAPEETERLFRAVAAKPELARLRGLVFGEHSITVGRLEVVLASPHLANLRYLQTVSVGYDFDPDGGGGQTPDHGPRVLAAVVGLPALTGLDLAESGISAEDLESLLVSPLAGRLTSLGLGYDAIGDEGAERLAAAPGLSRLERLTLYCNGITDRGARALAASPHLGRLARLALLGNDISPAGEAVLRARYGASAVSFG